MTSPYDPTVLAGNGMGGMLAYAIGPAILMVGILYSVRNMVGLSLHAANFDWWLRLPDAPQLTFAERSAFCIVEGLLAFAFVYSAQTDDRLIFNWAVCLSLATQLSDVSKAMLEGKGFTGHEGVPSLLNFSCLLLMESVHLGLDKEANPWHDTAMTLCYFTLVDALDLAVIRLLVKTPFNGSKSHIIILLWHLVYNVFTRGYLFVLSVIAMWTHLSALAFVISASAAVALIFIAVYHILLIMGIVFALNNGGSLVNVRQWVPSSRPDGVSAAAALDNKGDEPRQRKAHGL